MRNAVQIVNVIFSKPAYVVLHQQVVENEPVQRVNLQPRQCSRPHTVHGRPITGAPGVNKARPVGVNPVLCTESSGFADQAAAPVHDGTEHIEGQCLHVFLEQGDDIRLLTV